MNTHFTIAIDCCNQEEWIERCIASCVTQRYDNFDVILLDAISTDKTFTLAKEYEKDFSNFKAFQNTIRKPQIGNIYELTFLAKNNSVLVSVDGDDWLKNKNVLSKLNEIYSSGDVWMTYGSYEEFPYRSVKFHYHAYPDDVIKNNQFREYKWLASHLRTYKKELFAKINIKDLQFDNGKWFDTTGDQAFMIPMLEMSGTKSRYIDEVLYTYNVGNQTRDTALNESRQVEMANYIRSKPKYNPIDSL